MEGYTKRDFIGALALVCLLLVCPFNASALCHGLGGRIWGAYGLSFTVIVLLSIVIFCVVGLVAWRCVDDDRLSRLFSRIAPLAIFGYGFLLLAPYGEQVLTMQAALVIAAVLLGAGGASAAFVWAVSFAGMEVSRAFAVFSGCFLASALLRIVLEGVPFANVLGFTPNGWNEFLATGAASKNLMYSLVGTISAAVLMIATNRAHGKVVA